MICERCGTVFCWDGADEGALGGDRKRYCSDSCRKDTRKIRKHRAQVLLQMCRDRPKPRYASEEDALRGIAGLARIPPLYPYPCPCGGWHLTVQAPGSVAAFLSRAVKS